MDTDFRTLWARGASFIGLASVVLALAFSSGAGAGKSGGAIQQVNSCALETGSSPATLAKCRPIRTTATVVERRPARSDVTVVAQSRAEAAIP